MGGAIKIQRLLNLISERRMNGGRRHPSAIWFIADVEFWKARGVTVNRKDEEGKTIYVINC